MRPRISIRGFVRPWVGPWVGPWVRNPLTKNAILARKFQKIPGNSRKFFHSQIYWTHLCSYRTCFIYIDLIEISIQYRYIYKYWYNFWEVQAFGHYDKFDRAKTYRSVGVSFICLRVNGWLGWKFFLVKKFFLMT